MQLTALRSDGASPLEPSPVDYVFMLLTAQCNPAAIDQSISAQLTFRSRIGANCDLKTLLIRADCSNFATYVHARCLKLGLS